MYLYLQKQNLNFATTLTKQILTNENAIKIVDTRIKEEKSQLKQNEAFLKIDYLTIMILGVTGLGNSTLVNSLLKLKKPEAALVGYGDIKITEIKIFNSKKQNLIFFPWKASQINLNKNIFGLYPYNIKLERPKATKNIIEELFYTSTKIEISKHTLNQKENLVIIN